MRQFTLEGIYILMKVIGSSWGVNDSHVSTFANEVMHALFRWDFSVKPFHAVGMRLIPRHAFHDCLIWNHFLCVTTLVGQYDMFIKQPKMSNIFMVSWYCSLAVAFITYSHPVKLFVSSTWICICHSKQCGLCIRVNLCNSGVLGKIEAWGILHSFILFSHGRTIGAKLNNRQATQ